MSYQRLHIDGSGSHLEMDSFAHPMNRTSGSRMVSSSTGYVAIARSCLAETRQRSPGASSTPILRHLERYSRILLGLSTFARQYLGASCGSIAMRITYSLGIQMRDCASTRQRSSGANYYLASAYIPESFSNTCCHWIEYRRRLATWSQTSTDT